ncbi:MAG: hypothetical protein F7C35_02280 [Desulfurococcales archaeon]|nr:hypothetical protein [Desulfurococcales archaeon]
MPSPQNTVTLPSHNESETDLTGISAVKVILHTFTDGRVLMAVSEALSELTLVYGISVSYEIENVSLLGGSPWYSPYIEYEAIINVLGSERVITYDDLDSGYDEIKNWIVYETIRKLGVEGAFEGEGISFGSKEGSPESMDAVLLVEA